MPRQSRRRADGPSRPAGAAGQHTDDWRGEQFTVRAVSGRAATKPYRCPGCDQEVRSGTPHVVVWPDADIDATDRRHWHSGCWSARSRRGPAVLRSRNAPRY